VKPVAVSYPIALKLAGKRCLVLGNGAEARERARALLRSGASVRLITTAPSPELERAALLTEGVELAERDFGAADLDETWLVVLAERDDALAERLRAATEARRIFFCAVDMPSFSSFSFVALARAGLVFAALGTEGQAPALARRLREILEQLFEQAALGAFTEKLAALRSRTPPERRREVLGAAVAGVRVTGELVLPELESERG
jgi:siroheme synthase-like protein